MSKPARLAVGVISAGRVGAVLGAALHRVGHHVVAASAVSKDSVGRAAELLPGVPLVSPDQVAARADLVLLAIPDDALAGTVRGLVATESLRAGQIVLHTSGAHGVDVLAPAAGVGVLPLAVHPAMTFTGRPEDLQRIAACSFGITAPDAEETAWHVAEALVMEVGGEPVRVPQAARPIYHAALTHGANHLITLVNECVDLLRSAGIGGTGPGAPERLIGPLLSAALDNALRHGDRALTGPVARGDVGTVRTHLSALADTAPEVLPSYRELAARTATRAVSAGLLSPGAADEVRATLREEP
ncbi:MAG TPA: DUF2520 domain-containing protein [Pseudonocardiaceae bacterium]|jgi:predicted short-subunit dehydrogenase-like oxidoreductase (DUF2520 family)|nr:DUF2520 domain-containing protein [Pseudonocardiaceae bacterium]